MFYVYILKSLLDQKFYIGQTNDLHKRLARHNAGQVRSTKGRIPLELVRHETFVSRAEAMKREKYLKSLKGSAVFKNIVEGT